MTTIHNDFLSIAETSAVIAAVGSHSTISIKGETGIGKTVSATALASTPAFANHIFSLIDCTQLSDGSLWIPTIDNERGVSRELPNERFGVHALNQRGINDARPVFIVLDEKDKAPRYVQNMLAPVEYERRLGNYHFPDGSVVVTTSNLGAEGFGDASPAYIKSRVVNVFMRKPTATELGEYAADRCWHPVVQVLLDQCPSICDSFIDYQPGGRHEGKRLAADNPMIFDPTIEQDAFASPRTLERASRVLTSMEQAGLPTDLIERTLRGTIGHAATAELMTYYRLGSQLTAFERIVSDPESAPIPTNPVAQLMQTLRIVGRAQDRTEADAVTRYITRLRPEMQTLFVKRVSSSNTAISIYLTVPTFGALMADNRIFFKA